MRKISTMQQNGKKIFKGQLTIGLDLGDRSSAYCVLNEAGEIVLEHKLATTPEAMKQVFGSMPRCRIAMETGSHSPWVSRLLTALGRETPSALNAGLRQALEPLVQEIESLNDRIKEYDWRIEKMAKQTYPETTLLKQVKGVGDLIATAYVLTIEDPHRFRKSRDAGCFAGLQPGRRNSGESEPQMRISKEGDEYLRTLLVQGAHYILGPFGEDSDLRRWGQKLAA